MNISLKNLNHTHLLYKISMHLTLSIDKVCRQAFIYPCLSAAHTENNSIHKMVMPFISLSC